MAVGCQEKTSKRSGAKVESTKNDTITLTEERVKEQPKVKMFTVEEDTTFVLLTDYSDDFVFDMKYATEDNFLKSKVYDCDECYVRTLTAKALIAANAEFMKMGYRIKFFDCYRPLDVQKKMWKIFPNPIYVADPALGSIHNRGGAVDITLVDLEGNELDMGTTFDFFGKEAHHAYQGFSSEVLSNRKLLKETMEKHGFLSITSEWWHYNLKALSRATVANFKWNCDI